MIIQKKLIFVLSLVLIIFYEYKNCSITISETMDSKNNSISGPEVKTIDESLYSRQLYAIGKEAMGKITQTNVLISGLTGAGIELAKCVILAGVKKVTLHTPIDVLTHADLTSNYYAYPDGVGLPFLEETRERLASLNSNVFVDTAKVLTQKDIKRYDIAVFCDYMVHNLLFWNRICRENNTKFIMIQTQGLAGNLFCD
jgi:ubiquitin-activating enzyme E1